MRAEQSARQLNHLGEIVGVGIWNEQIKEEKEVKKMERFFFFFK